METRALAEFVAGSRREDIPPAVRREGVRSLLNFVGCALGGCRDEAIEIAVKVLAPLFGPAQAGIIGRGGRADIANAAFLNGASANVLEYDDTHLATVIHPAAPVAPGLLALAELRRHLVDRPADFGVAAEETHALPDGANRPSRGVGVFRR